MTFNTIVADPPWPYSDRLMSGQTTRRRTRGAANHYPVMSMDALKGLRPQLVAGADAHFYLWTTNAFIYDALVLMRLWGFEHKTVLTWVKPQIGMGWFFRNNTEHVLFGVRGKRLRTACRDVPTAFVAPRGKHSEKPAMFYEMVERMSPGPYLELFARRERHGWMTVGDEIDGRSLPAALHVLEGLDDTSWPALV